MFNFLSVNSEVDKNYYWQRYFEDNGKNINLVEKFITFLFRRNTAASIMKYNFDLDQSDDFQIDDIKEEDNNGADIGESDYSDEESYDEMNEVD